MKGSLVNFICEAKSGSKQDVIMKDYANTWNQVFQVGYIHWVGSTFESPLIPPSSLKF